MAPRVNLGRAGLVARAEDDKPNTVSSMAVPIAVCIARNVKRQRAEDANDPHAHLDFGTGDAPIGGGKKKLGRKSILMMGGEKGQHKTNQLSMDMNLESPYLLPPQAQNSHDSVHSLTRNYPQEYDPYRMVSSECGNSIRSYNKETGGLVPRVPYSPSDNASTPVEKETLAKDPFATPPPAPEPTHQGPAQPQLQDPILPVQPVVPEIDTVPYPDEKEAMPRVPSIQEPPPAMAKSPEDRRYSPPRDGPHQFELPGMAQSDNIGMASGGDISPPPRHPNNQPDGLGLNLDLPQPMSPLKDDMFGNQQHIQPQSAQIVSADSRLSKESDYGYQDAYQPQIQTSEYYDQYEDDGRGRSRQSRMDLDMQQQQQSQGLGVPQQDNKRLSVGFRPLPPDEALESEDPEYRANRIRSFYKSISMTRRMPPRLCPTSPLSTTVAPSTMRITIRVTQKQPTSTRDERLRHAVRSACAAPCNDTSTSAGLGDSRVMLTPGLAAG
ncbi:hypothetical protein L7F22_013386 [Adiantum nelumboides]|nr:hypothetical protein [Adiantum nelumboides]